MTRQKDDSREAAFKEIPSVELVNDIWRTRRKSNLVKWLMAKGCQHGRDGSLSGLFQTVSEQ